MMKVFQTSGGGKMGASLAVIVAHAAPFMGAQTTLMQRYFLPHPLDTIISQPFGMSEDLISMAMAEAGSNPSLASRSLTLIIFMLNFAQFGLFSISNGQARKAAACAIMNLILGVAFAMYLEGPELPHAAFVIVALQLATQVILVPVVLRFIMDSSSG